LIAIARRTLSGAETQKELARFAWYEYWHPWGTSWIPAPPREGLSDFEQLVSDLAYMHDLYDEDVVCDEEEADALVTAQARRIVALADDAN
jgi:hypothetical protein